MSRDVATSPTISEQVPFAATRGTTGSVSAGSHGSPFEAPIATPIFPRSRFHLSDADLTDVRQARMM
jgi:hypothetical protein